MVVCLTLFDVYFLDLYIVIVGIIVILLVSLFLFFRAATTCTGSYVPTFSCRERFVLLVFCLLVLYCISALVCSISLVRLLCV